MNPQLRAKKKLGQHFLKDSDIVDKICCEIDPDCDAIIEIGPGKGALTEGLARLGKALYVFEKDRRFESLLRAYTPEVNTVDALRVDFESLCLEKGCRKPWVVGNLPYNASVALFIKFLRTSPFGRMTLMFQREVARKILDPCGKNKNRGSLMALGQNYFQIRIVAELGPQAFDPRPKVDSTILGFRRITSPSIPLDQCPHFERFLRLAFSQRRKQLSKVLSCRHPRERVNAILSSLGFDVRIRAEEMTCHEVGILYKRLESDP